MTEAAQAQHRQGITRRAWLRRCALAVAAAGAAGLQVTTADAIGPRSWMTLAQLEHGEVWNPREGAIPALTYQTDKRTSIAIAEKPVAVSPLDTQLFENPFLIWSGERAIPPLTEAAVENLAVFLKAGGFMLVDSSEGLLQGDFHRSVKRELKRVLPSMDFVDAPLDHVLHKSFYLLNPEEPWGTHDVKRRLEIIQQDDRVLVAFSHNDLQGGWLQGGQAARMGRLGVSENRHLEYSVRYGINLIMYALCTNYKADQVHIPFILKQRTWRVD